MSFRLVQNSVTSDDLERHNSPNRSVIFTEFGRFRADYVKVWLKIHQYFPQRKCRPQNVVFSDISFMAILAGVTPSDSDKVRHSALAIENLTNNQR